MEQLSAFERLPIEIQNHIFKHLGIKEIFILKLVSKKLNLIAESFEIKELWLCEHLSKDCKTNWTSKTRSLNIEKAISTSKLYLIKNPAKNFLALKYLKIDKVISGSQLERLNQFKLLETLDVYFDGGNEDGEFWSNRRKKNFILKLPNLKILSIQTQVMSSDNLVICCPNLHSLYYFTEYCDLIEEIKFEHPDSIKHLKINMYDNLCDLSIFSNLETIEYDIAVEQLYEDELLEMSNMKKVKVNNNEIIDCLKEVTNKLKNRGIELFFKNVKIKETSKFDEYERHWDDLKFQLENYDELENDLMFETCIEYNELLSLFPIEQPKDFFKKYNNIQEIRIGANILDRKRLTDFIKGCKDLIDLSLKFSQLDQRFYDELPSISHLVKLEINEKNDVGLNFEFLMKLSHLKMFITNQDVSLDENLNLNALKWLRKFTFLANDNYLPLSKVGKDKYKFSYKLRSMKNFPEKELMTFDELVDWVAELYEPVKTKKMKTSQV